MSATQVLRRRAFLVSSAATAGAMMLAACGGGASGGSNQTGGGTPTPSPTTSAGTGGGKAGGGGGKGATPLTKGSATTPLTVPATLHESPALAALVKAGKLPKLADRLPEEPYVIPHSWVRNGNYGGSLTMLISSTSNDSAVGEWDYGFSPLRFLNDGQDIGPGIVVRWKSNADTSQWEFTLRKGLRWSDGKPVTTADVLFWWQDMVNDDAYTPEAVPDECKSGKGTICKLSVKDEQTWVMHFDAPAPLTGDRLAMWTNGYGGNGPTWIIASHFVKQFHPKYNPKVPKSWAAVGGLWESHASYRRNPKCPTLTSYRLSQFSDGKSLTWERNPYCYAVTKDGDQLPYIDQRVMTVVQDPQVGKLKIQHGEIDMSFAAFNSVVLADVSGLNKAAKASGIQVLFWDSGSGTAASMFLNQDYYDQKYRDLFNSPKFRQALSHGFDRDQARTAIYFNTGVPTTGTMSVKAMEFNLNAQGKKVYTDWRDSYVKYDPARANRLLDGLGLKDADGDGYREFPDGSKLTIVTNRPADATDEYVQRDNQQMSDFKKIGIRYQITPSPPTSFAEIWAAGKYMVNSNWGIGDGPNCLVYPQWLVPMENSRWAPLQGQMYASRGTKAYASEQDVDPWKRKPPRRMPDKSGPVAKLWALYDKTKVEPDQMKRVHLVWQIVKIHIADGPYVQGTDANFPRPVVIKNGLSNVPTHDQLFLGGFTDPWTHPTPAVYDPETFFWDEPSKHNV